MNYLNQLRVWTILFVSDYIQCSLIHPRFAMLWFLFVYDCSIKSDILVSLVNKMYRWILVYFWLISNIISSEITPGPLGI
eukprot:UN21990